MIRLLIAIFVLLSLTSCAQTTQPDKGKQQIDKVCDQFMELFVANKVSDAMKLLKQNTVMSPSSIDTLESTINDQVSNLFQAYGKMIGYEFVQERNIKNFISKRFYILKFDEYYLKFDFTQYNNSKKWTITGFNYNEDLIELLY